MPICSSTRGSFSRTRKKSYSKPQRAMRAINKLKRPAGIAALSLVAIGPLWRFLETIHTLYFLFELPAHVREVLAKLPPGTPWVPTAIGVLIIAYLVRASHPTESQGDFGDAVASPTTAAEGSSLQRRFIHEADRRYRTRIATRLRHADMVPGVVFELDKIYIRLRADRFSVPWGQPDLGSKGSQPRQPNAAAAIDAADLLVTSPPRIVVVGDPGSGKTTLLRYLARRLAIEDPALRNWASNRNPSRVARFVTEVLATVASARHIPSQRVRRGFSVIGEAILRRAIRYPLPILVTLNDVTRATDRLETYLAHVFAGEYADASNYDAAVEAFHAKLAAESCVVLLDAFDEIVGDDARRHVIGLISDFAQRFAQTLIIVTGRSAALRDQLILPTGFVVRELQQFDPDQIGAFIETWFHLSERPELGATLTKALERNVRMRQLSHNPLMLSLICWTHENTLRLPDRRVELYDKCADELLKQRDERRIRDQDPRVADVSVSGALKFDARKKRLLLQLVARRFHDDGQEGRPFEYEPLTNVIKTAMPKLGYKASMHDAMLREIMERSGLIKLRSESSYSFNHLTFQEFFLAEYYHQHRSLEISPLDHIGDDHWREVIFLYIGLSSDPVPELKRLIAQSLVMAAEALPDARSLRTRAFRDLTLEILRDLRPATEAAPTSTRAVLALATVLEWLEGADGGEWFTWLADDPGSMLPILTGYLGRTGVENDRLILSLLKRLNLPLVPVPAGTFTMGDNAQPDLQPHRVSLSRFWISQFPITNGLFLRFCRETGRSLPPLFDSSKANHPVTNVMWSDAFAFCQWAGVSLPTEAQWERAARGEDGRRYPWGNEWDPNISNVGHPNNGTTPVGEYSGDVSPCGCYDMAGNVQEWTRSQYGPITSPRELDAVRPESAERAVLKGSSFQRPFSQGVRAAARDWMNPLHRSLGVGFRVALAVPQRRDDSSTTDAQKAAIV